MDITLNRYIEIIPCKAGNILFNKINGNILLLDDEDVIQDNNKIVVRCTDHVKNSLETYGFFIDETDIQSYIRSKCSRQGLTKCTDVILSVTERCNLSCKYCYQSSWNRDEALSEEEFFLLAVEYLEKAICIINHIGGFLNIHFIGGEPLLKKNLIIKIINKILAFAKGKNYNRTKIRFFLDTNGVYLTREFMQYFPNLSVNITMSSKSDHDFLRSKSFDKLKGALINIADFFTTKNYKLTIRFNVHHGNIDGIDDFLSEIDSIKIRYTLDVQNIMNTQSSKFINRLSDTEFEKLYLTRIVPCLIKHNLEADILPQYGLSRHCSCANILSRKLYSNGQFALCDAMPKASCNLPVGEMPELTEKCIQCFDFPYCGGAKPCDVLKCDGHYADKDLVRNRIVAYVEYSGFNK